MRNSRVSGAARYTPYTAFDLPDIAADAMAGEMTELPAARPRPDLLRNEGVS